MRAPVVHASLFGHERRAAEAAEQGLALPVEVMRLPRTWAGLSLAAALLSAAGAVVGLLDRDRIYGLETPSLMNAAIAQDLVQLVVVAPLIVVLARAASQGSVAARLVWLGCLAFTSYGAAIYAFAIHFGPLFPVWVAVLGLSAYALGGGLATVDQDQVRRCAGGRPQRWTAGTLIALATLFTALWVSRIIADLVSGAGSSSAALWRVPTDPVHVLDLAFFLPGVFAVGVLLARRRALGYATAPGALVFLGLTCLPILATPVVATVRGDPASVPVVVPIGIVLAATAVALWRTLEGLRPARFRTR